MAPKIVFYLFLLVHVVEFQMSFGQGDVNGAYWLADAGVPASDIDSTLFTHLFCAFANLDPQTNKVTLPSASFSQFTPTVRRKNPSVKTLLSIGGGNVDPAIFPAMASQPSSRKSFIDSSISVARANGFSGLDLDWEYPRTTKQMADLESLLKEWRAALAAEAASSGRSPLLLTAAFYYAPKINELSYPVQAIQKNMDWVNAMAYDFYDPSYSKVTRPHSALYDPAGPFSGSYGIQAWIAAGLGAKKLVLGMPLYGKAWRLVDPSKPGFLVPTSGSAIPNNQYGDISYKDIKKFISDNGATQGYNSTYVSNYCYAGTTFIGYDDVESISAKVSYAKKKGLRGYFEWQAAQDLNWALSKRAKQTWGA
ncbi:class V chitinase-like [Ipomoea triloba]|uniref:class V chitinase-like n=1 Tax=Ipomoea triloba TaxID=35885 RepID=UPI00125E8978|nr:class V chitinase-like [Ipomoea triloba]